MWEKKRKSTYSLNSSTVIKIVKSERVCLVKRGLLLNAGSTLSSSYIIQAHTKNQYLYLQRRSNIKLPILPITNPHSACVTMAGWPAKNYV